MSVDNDWRTIHMPPPPLQVELQHTETSYLQPRAFFVSWQGVLTLAFTGWTRSICDLKLRIAAAHPALPAEASGSKWPKMTLGCLHDGVTLSKGQTKLLNSLCKKFSEEVFGNSTTIPKIAIDSASIAVYENRSLEKLISLQTIQFCSARNDDGPDDAQKSVVESILDEADEDDYHKAVARAGHRLSHYTTPALGVTLMHSFIQTPGAGSPRSHVARAGLRERGMQEIMDRQMILKAIHEFHAQVDQVLPGLYRWFSDVSLHITLRGIM